MTPDRREEELRFRLRGAADEHRPDREAMLARIERRRTESTRVQGAFRPEQRGFRPLVAAAAIVGVLGLGVGGTWLVADVGRPDRPDAVGAAPPPPVTAAPSTDAAGPTASTPGSPDPSATPPAAPTASPTRSVPSRPPRTTTGAPPASLPIETMPEGNAPERGWLWSDGAMDPNSNAHWAQSTVTLRNKTEMTALDVTIRVAASAGVRTTGNWSSISSEKLVSTVREQSGWLYYRFRLRNGATIAPGSYVFAGQFDPSGDRSTDKDSYLAAASAGSQALEVHGGF